MEKIYLTIIVLLSSAILMGQSVPDRLTYPHTAIHPQSKSNHAFTKKMESKLTTVNAYVPGATMDLTFTLELTNLDEEYGDSLSLTFPAGIVPNSSPNNPLYTSPDPMATPEAYNGVSGQVISWGNNDNSYGGLTTPNTITFVVNVTVENGLTGEKTGSYHLSGDGYGTNPSDQSGNFTISNVTPPADLSLRDFSGIKYFSTPIRHFTVPFFKALVVNNGGKLTDDVLVNFTAEPVGFSANAALKNPMEFGETDTVESPAFTPPGKGVNILSITAIYPQDEDQSDNSDTSVFSLTDSIFSYNSGNPAVATPLGVGDGGTIGASYELKSQDTLTTVKVFFKKPGVGSSARISIYEFRDTVEALIAQSAYTTFSDSTEKTVLFDLSPDVVLPAGKFFVSVDQGNSINYGLGTAFENFSNMSIFARVLATGPFYPLEVYGPQFARTPYIEPNFGSTSPSSGIPAVTSFRTQLYPNPNNGEFTLVATQPSKAYVYNYLGAIVRMISVHEGSQMLDLTELSSGHYVLCLEAPGNIERIKLSIIR